MPELFLLFCQLRIQYGPSLYVPHMHAASAQHPSSHPFRTCTLHMYTTLVHPFRTCTIHMCTLRLLLSMSHLFGAVTILISWVKPFPGPEVVGRPDRGRLPGSETMKISRDACMTRACTHIHAARVHAHISSYAHRCMRKRTYP